VETTPLLLPPELVPLLNAQTAWHYRAVPGALDGNELEVFTEPERVTSAVSEELELVLGRPVRLRAASAVQVEQTLNKYYLRQDSARNPTGPPVATGSAALNSEDFLYQLIREAREVGSSDIHVETYAEKARIRLRIDGMLVERYHLPQADYPALVNRLKIMAGLDIAEKRLPQDGRIFFAVGNQKTDLRVSVMPTLYGEKVVLRLLGSDATNIELSSLGFREET